MDGDDMSDKQQPTPLAEYERLVKDLGECVATHQHISKLLGTAPDDMLDVAGQLHGKAQVNIIRAFRRCSAWQAEHTDVRAADLREIERRHGVDVTPAPKTIQKSKTAD